MASLFSKLLQVFNLAPPETIAPQSLNGWLIELAEAKESRFWSVDFDELSKPEQVFRLIWELEAEVNNGGFLQYFGNSSGTLAGRVCGALVAIGANRTAGIARKAIELFGSDIAFGDSAARNARIGTVSEETADKLNQLDEAFYTYPNDLTKLLHGYVIAHHGDFALPANFPGVGAPTNS